MRHSAVRKNLSAYLDGELSQEQWQKIDVHLNSCDSCQKELQEVQCGKLVTTYFKKPEWQGSERLWHNINSVRRFMDEKAAGERFQSKRSQFLQRLIHPKPAFAFAVLAILFAANWLTNIKQEGFQYQQARVDWIPNYVFDYGLYLDALIAGESPGAFDKRYDSQMASFEQARSQTTFRLASFTRMPKTFQLREVRLLKSACCRSVQFVCSKNSMPVVIFQQPKGHPVTFGNYPLERMQINGRVFHRVKAGSWTALSWEGADSQFVGVGEMNEVDMTAIVFAVTPL